MLKAGIGIEKDEETTEEQYMYSCFWKLQINVLFGTYYLDWNTITA